jgi:hypothetical protein
MFVRLTKSGYALDLAGETPQSETVGFGISSEGVFQRAEYIDTAQATQFFRGGSMANVSFTSRLEFPSVADAEAYLLTTPQGLLSQTGQSVTIGTLSASGTKQVETLTCVGNATGDGNIAWTLTVTDIGTQTGSAAVLTGDTPTQYAVKLAASLNAVSLIRARYTIAASGETVIVTKRQAEANESGMSLVTTNGSPSPGITGATSANTAAGVAPTIGNAITLSNVSCVLNLAQTGVSIARNVTLQGKY